MIWAETKLKILHQGFSTAEMTDYSKFDLSFVVS